MTNSDLREIVIKASVPHNWKMIAAGLGYCALAVLGMQDKPWMMWIAIVFFGGVAVVGIYRLFQSFDNENQMILGPSGFRIVQGKRQDSYEWMRCSEFAIKAIPAGRLAQIPIIAFLHNAETPSQLAKVEAGDERWWLSKDAICLSSEWEMELEELCETLNSYRDQALAVMERG